MQQEEEEVTAQFVQETNHHQHHHLQQQTHHHHQQEQHLLPSPPQPQPLPKPIRLLRVPKAGSSSLSAFLRLQYDCITDEFPFGDCTFANSISCPQIRGCTDHINTKHININDESGGDAVENPAPPWVTMVRDPVNRYVSAYYYPGHHGKGTDGDIIRHIQLFPEWNNTQVNFFAGKQIGNWEIPLPPSRRRRQRQRRKNTNQRQNNNNDPTTTTTTTNVLPPQRRKLQEAQIPNKEEKENRLQIALDQIGTKAAFVGLLEYFNDSLRLFCRIYDCPRPIEEALMKAAQNKERYTGYGNQGFGNNNNSNNHNSPSYPYNNESAMEAIRGSNINDIILYEASVQRYCVDLLSFQKDDAFWATISEASKTKCL